MSDIDDEDDTHREVLLPGDPVRHLVEADCPVLSDENDVLDLTARA